MYFLACFDAAFPTLPRARVLSAFTASRRGCERTRNAPVYFSMISMRGLGKSVAGRMHALPFPRTHTDVRITRGASVTKERRPLISNAL